MSNPFIITTPTTPPVDANRRLIRSHVMRGRNRKKPPPRPPPWMTGPSPDSTLKLPVQVGGDFSFVPLLAEMDPDLLETAWNLKNATTPLELSSPRQTSWFDPVWTDAACLHFTIYVANVFANHVRGRQTSNRVLAHFGSTLRILQERMGDAYMSDSTLLVVVGLTMTATAFGHYDTAQKHLDGLARMVALRGGMSNFGGELRAKMADLGVVLSTGCKTAFFNHVSWESYLAQPRRPIVSKFEPPSDVFLERLDPRLRLVWSDVSEVARAANVATQCKLSVDADLYREVLVSVHYRLVNLSLEDDDEAMRLGLLAFASTLFLQWRGVRTHYPHLAQELKSAVSRTKVPTHVKVWLFVVTAYYDTPWIQPRLARSLQHVGLKSWDEARELVKSVLWIDALHDDFAKGVVEAALAAETAFYSSNVEDALHC